MKTLRNAINGVMREVCQGVRAKLPASYLATKDQITSSPSGDACDLMFKGFDKNDLECAGIVYVALIQNPDTRLPQLEITVSFEAPLRKLECTKVQLPFEGSAPTVARAVAKLIAG